MNYLKLTVPCFRGCNVFQKIVRFWYSCIDSIGLQVTKECGSSVRIMLTYIENFLATVLLSTAYTVVVSLHYDSDETKNFTMMISLFNVPLILKMLLFNWSHIKVNNTVQESHWTLNWLPSTNIRYDAVRDLAGMAS